MTNNYKYTSKFAVMDFRGLGSVASTTVILLLLFLFLEMKYIGPAKNATEYNNTSTTESYRFIQNFDIIQNDNCTHKGVLTHKNNQSKHYLFNSIDRKNIKKRETSMQRCFEIEKAKNESLTSMDFFKAFFTYDFKESYDCQDYQSVLQFVPVVHPDFIVLHVGEVNNIDVWAAMPRRPYHVYKIETFMHENIDQILAMFIDENDIVNASTNESAIPSNPEINPNGQLLASQSGSEIKGPASLLYLLGWQIRCSDPQLLPINIKEDLDKIAALNNDGFAFDISDKLLTKKQKVLIFFDRKRVKYDIDANIGRMYAITAIYSNDSVVYGKNFMDGVNAENRPNESFILSAIKNRTSGGSGLAEDGDRDDDIIEVAIEDYNEQQ